MNESQRKLHTSLTLLFWLNTITFGVVLLILLYFKGPGLPAQGNPLWERYAIIFTLAGIPLALKLFHSRYTKIVKSGEVVFLKKYFQAYLVRMLILDAVIVMNLIGFHMFESLNFIYMTIIVIFALFFCYPNKDALNIVSKTNENLE